MKQLHLPHKTADYLCPINGLADIYHWKTGNRIPDPLLFYARSGFLLLTSKKSDPPKMIFFSTSSIGKKQYEFWSSAMEYRMDAGEGGAFRNTLGKVRGLIDHNIPVIIFGLDMFHLPYHEKFYHKLHVPGHVVLMTGYDDTSIFVQDNSKTEIQQIGLADLELAWGNRYLDISRKNAYFGIDFADSERDSRAILGNAFADMAERFLNSPVKFMGKRGMEKLVAEFPSWHQNYNDDTLNHIYRFFIMFAGSVLPKLPKKLDESDQSGLKNPLRGTRDKFADTLERHWAEFGSENWLNAAEHFRKSGEIIEELASGFREDILNGCFQKAESYNLLFKELLETETKAYSEFLSC